MHEPTRNHTPSELRYQHVLNIERDGSESGDDISNSHVDDETMHMRVESGYRSDGIYQENVTRHSDDDDKEEHCGDGYSKLRTQMVAGV